MTIYKYTKSEEVLLGLLRKRKSISIRELTGLFYKATKLEKPFYSENSMRSRLDDFVRKIEHNDETFGIARFRIPGKTTQLVVYYPNRKDMPARFPAKSPAIQRAAKRALKLVKPRRKAA